MTIVPSSVYVDLELSYLHSSCLSIHNRAPAAPAPAIDETAANPSGSTTDSLSESRSELSVEVSGSSSAVRVESNKELRDKNGNARSSILKLVIGLFVTFKNRNYLK